MKTEAAVRQRSRIAGLDGLRGVLALCVILTHTTGVFAPSVTNVTHVDILGQAIVVFFVLSGFLIYYPFARAVVEGRSVFGGLRKYALGRVRRVFPAYLVIFLIANFLLSAVYVQNAVIVQHSAGIEAGTGTIVDPGVLALQVTLLQSYVPAYLQTGINPAWTLSVEIAYYALLPLVTGVVAMAFARRRSSGARPWLAAIIPAVTFIVIGLASRLAGVIWEQRSGLSPDMAEWGPTALAVFSRSVLTWSDNFGWGMLAAVLFLALRAHRLSAPAVGRIRRAAWGVGIAALVLSGVCYGLAPRFLSAAFAVFSLALIVLIISPTDGEGRVWRGARLLDNPVLHWLGVTSLSIYLWHYPVMIVLARLGWTGADGWAGAAWSFLLVTAVSGGLGSATYLLVEKPGMNLAWGRRQRETAR